MLLARPYTLSSLDDAVRAARRAGLDEQSARGAGKGAGRPIQILLTGLPSGGAPLLARHGRGPSSDSSAPIVVSAGGEAALVTGDRWSLFTLAARLGDEAAPGPALAGAITTTLSRGDGAGPTWTFGTHRWTLGERTRVMGILNVTPDSFSDGGRFVGVDAAMARATQLAEEGADILDVGGESTRPGAGAVPADEERRRVVPVIRALAKLGLPISVDTTKAEVAEAALDAGASVVNDVSGLAGGAALAELAARYSAGLVLMHMRGRPDTMQGETDYDDLLGEVCADLDRAVTTATAAGLPRAALAIDPGVGFAKTAGQSMTLLRRLEALSWSGLPILVGASRKSFIGAVTGQPATERLAGSLAAATLAAHHGAHILRVHDVAETVAALQVADAIRSAREEGTLFDEGSRFWRDDPRLVGRGG